MNPSDSDLPDDAFDAEAASWICEREEGFAPGRAEAFSVWCNASPRHAAAVARVEQAMALLDEMPAVRARLEARCAGATPAELPAWPSRTGRFAFRSWLAAAAAVAAVGFVVVRPGVPSPPLVEHHETDARSSRHVALRDGSSIDLNAGSELHVELGAAERRLTLRRGEAHFQVARDRTRPFVVTAAGVTVRAVGTAFNVRLAGDAVDVLVVEGSVEVANRDRQPSAAAAGRPVLEAGERVRVSRQVAAAELRVEKVDSSAMRSLLAWQDQMTSFIDVPLRELVARFNRRNATQLVLHDAELGERRVGGMIALDQVDAFVRLLEQDGDIRAERNGAEIVLRRAR